MARRDSDYSHVRRIADRGNGRDGLSSRARGEDRRPVRRTADRGNIGVDPDPRDLKIKRLRQRVRDLELQHEIRQLKQRIQDLEDSSSWKETEPEELVRDKLSGDEENPTNDDTIFDSSPTYDEYKDEEWYSWASSDGSNETVGFGRKSRAKNIFDYSKMSIADIINENYGDEAISKFCSIESIKGGGSTMVMGGSATTYWIRCACTVVQVWSRAERFVKLSCLGGV
ncbi:uncharacterized protein LOC110865711 [Helianthus annuus]|uniref:uncharacterized protein LOC110865711 n=1 Tax=Helianthus annuus TaxID=4232 RepID=UPI000B90394D|nr:uncharacterized protein LOC110865711 [Helianthus annuus]